MLSFFFFRSMKTNLIAFFADLFNVLEIHPAKCVSFNQGRNDLADGIKQFYFNFVNYYFVDVELESYLIIFVCAYEWLNIIIKIIC